MATMYLVNRFFPPALLGALPVKAKFVSIAILVSEGKLTRYEMPTRRRTARIPFPLPVRFKELLQRGVPPAILTGLDASWCSGTSWYFLCMFGLSPVYQLLLGDGMSGESSLVRAVPRGRRTPLSFGCQLRRFRTHNASDPSQQPTTWPP